jgi:hypothetical protein
MGARDDYSDAYLWTCCAKPERSTVENSRDVPPPFSPGCTTAASHLNAARILLISSPSKAATASSCGDTLAGMGFEVGQRSFSAAAREDFDGSACAVFLPDDNDLDGAIHFVNAASGTPTSPWMLVCNVDPEAVETRLQIAATETVDLLVEAIVGAVRSWHGQLAGSPYDIFLSYRRRDAAVAQTINRFMPSWWDRAVLRPGVDWASDIEIGISRCKLFVVFLRGDIPASSYIWRELELARQHEKPIVILGFRSEGEEVLERCGILPEDLELCELAEPDRNSILPRRRFRLQLAGTETTPMMHFSRLQEQLGWPDSSDNRYDYDTRETVGLLSLLRDYPNYRLDSNEPWVPIWNLITPVEKS